MDDIKLELIYKTFLQIQNENLENYENLKLDNRKKLYFASLHEFFVGS